MANSPDGTTTDALDKGLDSLEPGSRPLEVPAYSTKPLCSLSASPVHLRRSGAWGRSVYEQMIREGMARLGRVGEQEPEIVEAWMRVEHGTLDALSPAEFQREVGIALDCAREAGAEANERLARSYGFGASLDARAAAEVREGAGMVRDVRSEVE